MIRNLFFQSLFALALLWLPPLAALSREAKGEGSLLLLPKPKPKGAVSVEEAITSRRTRRNYSARPLTLESASQLLWAAQGITGEDGTLRAAPSGGALYPLDLYIVSGKGTVEGLEAGVYRYLPGRHGLQKIASGDLRESVARASLGQMWMAEAPVSIVVTAEYRRIEVKYGNRGRRYALMEAGHACQNIFLQAEALSLAAGIVGAFDDQRLAEALHLPKDHEPLIVMPVGYPGTR